MIFTVIKLTHLFISARFIWLRQENPEKIQKKQKK